MVSQKTGKTFFAVFVAGLIVSVGVMSYIYFDGGQEPYSGDPELDAAEENDISGGEDFAPDFTFYAVNGGTVSLSDLRGRVVVIDFMATWCAPCRDQIVNLKQIYGEYSETDVVIVSVDVDSSETSAELLAFRNELGASWDFVMDTTGISSVPEYDASSIPTMVFIGRDGSIASRDVGTMSVGDLRDAIDPLL
ncbi:MAG: TlpA disulfide reductase family protein [Thermoplasmata archaeon]|nr:TlpA disulfide reductase family protein [Thermoplasmata archaeon]